LQDIDLSYNQLASVPPSLLCNLQQLSALNVIGNPGTFDVASLLTSAKLSCPSGTAAI